jgi:S1-C subfamily serine protease
MRWGLAALAAVVLRYRDRKVQFAFLRIVPVQVTPELNQAFDLGSDTGVLVDAAVPAGPAAKAGMARGDVIVQLDDRKLELVEDLFAELRDHRPERRRPSRSCAAASAGSST